MRRFFLSGLIVAGLLAGGFYFYRQVYPDILAEAIVSDSLPPYIPKRIQSRIKDISTPISQGTEAVVEQMHARGIPMEELMTTIDETTEEQVYSLLDELNDQEPRNINEVFDIAKKHIPADFDPEVLREPFTRHVTMKQVGMVIRYANNNRKTHDVDFNTTKAVLKKIILEKEEEISRQERR